MKPNTKLVTYLAAITVGMFGFGFALVPLYDVFCDITGLNGKVENSATTTSFEADMNREIKVQFVTNMNEQMPWSFTAQDSSVVVSPGTNTKAVFRVENLTPTAMTGQAIPSVSPARAAQYFKKTQCFCFDNQVLQANESVDMAVIFTIDPDMPKDITKLTLSYTFFDITQS